MRISDWSSDVCSSDLGVVAVDELDGKAHKCTLCYDWLKGGMEPACSKVCPTESIQFGGADELQERARDRVTALHGCGVAAADLYGAPDTPGATGGIDALNAIFVLPNRADNDT